MSVPDYKNCSIVVISSVDPMILEYFHYEETEIVWHRSLILQGTN